MDVDKGIFVYLVVIQNMRRFPSEPFYFLCNLGGEVITREGAEVQGWRLKETEKMI